MVGKLPEHHAVDAAPLASEEGKDDAGADRERLELLDRADPVDGRGHRLGCGAGEGDLLLLGCLLEQRVACAPIVHLRLGSLLGPRTANRHRGDQYSHGFIHGFLLSVRALSQKDSRKPPCQGPLDKNGDILYTAANVKFNN